MVVVRKRLGEILVEAGVIDEAQLKAALGHQRRWGGKLGQALVDLRLTSEGQIAHVLAAKFGCEVTDVGALTRRPEVEEALRLVPRDVALKHGLIPVQADTHTITVAMADPTNITVVDEISFRTGRRVKVTIAGGHEIEAALKRLYSGEGPDLAPIAFEGGGDDLPLVTTQDPFGALAAAPPLPATPPGEGPTAPPRLTRDMPGLVAAPAVAPSPPGHGPSVPPRLTRDPPSASRAGASAQHAVPARAAPARPPAHAEPADVLPEEEPEPLTHAESALRDLLDRLARGESAVPVTPGQLAAATFRILLRRGVVTERELLDELKAKRG